MFYIKKKKHNGAKRDSGGIVVYVSEQIACSVSFLKITADNIYLVKTRQNLI